MNVRDSRRALETALLLALAACSGKESARPPASPPGVLVIQGSIELATVDRRAPAPHDDRPSAFNQEDPPPEGGEMSSVAVHVLDLATRKATLVAMMPDGLEPVARLRGGASLRVRNGASLRSRMQNDGALWDIEHRDGRWNAAALGDGPARDFVISRDGSREAFACGERADALCISGIGGASAEQEVTNPLASARPLGWLDDGRLVVGSTLYSADSRQVVVLDPATNKASAPFAFAASAGVAAVSPGGQLAWAEAEGDRVVLIVGSVDALATARRIDLGSGHGAECSFAREDAVVCRATMDRGHPLVSISLTDGATRVLDDEALHFVVSPDGRWVAYVMLDNGGRRVRVTPIDRAAPTAVLPGDPLVEATLLGWLQEPPS